MTWCDWWWTFSACLMGSSLGVIVSATILALVGMATEADRMRGVPHDREEGWPHGY